MDRTIEESQQLDVLFEQMLASRQQQNQSLAQVQGHLTSTQGILQTQLAAPLNLNSVIGMTQELKEEYDESAHLEYADECEEYCQESHTLWKGKFYIFMINSYSTMLELEMTCHSCNVLAMNKLHINLLFIEL